MTDQYGVIGHPITHSKSPVIHRLFAEQTGQDIAYRAFDIPPDQLEPRFHGLLAGRVRGLNVTVPHKIAIAPLLTRLSPRAGAAGAVNTVIVHADGTTEGDNTDGTGLITDLTRNLGYRLRDRRVLILGAGGATRGIVPALLDAHPRDLWIANRTLGKAQALATEFVRLGRVLVCRYDELGGRPFDLVINATSAGLQGETPPFPPSVLGPGTLSYDLSYAMQDTPFVAWASRHGSGRVSQGWGMLVEQAAESFFLWRGVRPDTGPIVSRLPGAPGATDSMRGRLA